VSQHNKTTRQGVTDPWQWYYEELII